MRVLLILLFGLATAAQASSILTLSFDVTPQTGFPGQVAEFSGTLFNNTGNTEFINSDSFTFAIPGAVNDSSFLNFAPISLGPNALSTDFEMLAITVPNGEAPGHYQGVLTVLGGTTGSAMDTIGSASFEVDVPTPEPGSLLLAAAGAALLLLRRRRANP